MKRITAILLVALAVIMLVSCSINNGRNTMANDSNQNLESIFHWNWPEIRDYLFLSGRGAHPEMKYGIHSFRLSVKELRHRSFAPITTFLIKSV